MFMGSAAQCPGPLTGDSTDLCCWLSAPCRDQALEQEQEQLLLQDRPQLSFLDLDEDDVPLTPEHRLGMGTGGARAWPFFGAEGTPCPCLSKQRIEVLTGFHFQTEFQPAICMYL